MNSPPPLIEMELSNLHKNNNNFNIDSLNMLSLQLPHSLSSIDNINISSSNTLSLQFPHLIAPIYDNISMNTIKLDSANNDNLKISIQKSIKF